MTSDPAAVILCKCGHAATRHSEDEGCGNSECGCATFRESDRPVTPPTPAVRAVPPPPAAPVAPPPSNGMSAGQVISAGMQSSKKTTVALAERIKASLRDLKARIDAEQYAAQVKLRRATEQTAARREVERLERLLVEAKARARGEKPIAQTSISPTSGTHACDHCPRTFDSAQGLAVHLGRHHNVSRHA